MAGSAVPFLTRVCDEARERVQRAVATVDRAQMRERAKAAAPARSFLDALAAPGLSVIAEIKRASPSRGPIAAIPEPIDLATRYAEGGATAISVLTEPVHFRGSLEDLSRVAASVRVPVLRKDFVVDAYQLAEARAHGASAALLIVAALDDGQLRALLQDAAALGLDALVEVHTESEVRRAAAAHRAAALGSRLILGVNARNLATLEVDLTVVEQLSSDRPEDALLVAESGVHGPEDAARMAAAGADAILVGEHAASAADPAAAIAALRRAAAPSLQTAREHT